MPSQRRAQRIIKLAGGARARAPGHPAGHEEREALLAAVEEQGQERGLLRPLLFKLPLKVGKPDNPWLTQVYVHQGDVPR